MQIKQPIPTRLELLEALKRGFKADLELITRYIHYKDSNIRLLVHAAFREGCLMAIAHVLKQARAKDFIEKISDDDLLISILETCIYTGNRRKIYDLSAALPILPTCLLFNPSIKKVLEPKPNFRVHRLVATQLNKVLPSTSVTMIFNFVFSKDALISQYQIEQIAKSTSKTMLAVPSSI